MDSSGVLDLDRGWAELVGASVSACRVDVDECSELSISGSSLNEVSFTVEGAVVVEAWQSQFDGCDLSTLRFQSVRGVRFVGCKFVGTDFADARLEDVVFERCTFRYVNFRKARLMRVAFSDCSIDDVDLLDATMQDVDFEGSLLTKVNLERVSATRVDLRGASEIDLASFGRLDGFLVTEHQLPVLMYRLAFSVGLGVERPPDI